MNQILSYMRSLSVSQKILTIGWVLLIALMPFHAFISTWGGTTIGPYEVWKVWKELLLLALLIPAAAIVIKDSELRAHLKQSWIVRVAAAYTALHILLAVIVGGDLEATLYGLAVNLRIVAIFMLGYILSRSIDLPKKALVYLAILPAIAVIVVGLLQMFALPHNAFSWFGYDKDTTIAPMMNIDEQPDEIRIMSTLRGPNPLGAYLVLPTVLIVTLFMSNIRRSGSSFKSYKWLYLALIFVGSLVVIYGAHGRASWIALIASLGLVTLFSLPAKIRLWTAAALVVAAAALAGLTYLSRDTAFVQNVILHDNPETGGEISSNSEHVSASLDGIKDIAKRPITGCAPGCAGPASFHHEEGARLSENYFIQVGQEVGVLGLLLLLDFMFLAGLALWQQRGDALGLALLASLVGLSLANLLLHVWADDTLAYVWWGLAGAAIASSGFVNINLSRAKAGR